MIFKRKLPIPQEVKEEFPLSDSLAAIKAKNDEEIKKIFTGDSDKFLLVIGPCSADREDAVMEYVHRLKKLSEQVQDRIVWQAHIIEWYSSQGRIVKCIVRKTGSCNLAIVEVCFSINAYCSSNLDLI